MNLARHCALGSAIVNVTSMFLAAVATDHLMFIASMFGAAVSTYGWVFFLEEVEIMARRETGHTDLAMRLRWEITNELLKPGDKLPGSRDLAAKHHMSRRAAMMAVQTLHDEGLIEKWSGRGWYVAGGRPSDKPRDTIEWRLMNVPPGQRLPTIEGLHQETGVGLCTINRVIRDLVRREVLGRERGRIYRLP